jgi:hypothetical protein
VHGGRAADAISKAISKCLKEKVESKNGEGNTRLLLEAKCPHLFFKFFDPF